MSYPARTEGLVNRNKHLYPVMANGIRTGDLRGFNKGRSSKFREGSRVRQTPEEAGGHIGRNIVKIRIKMKTILRKPLMIYSVLNSNLLLIWGGNLAINKATRPIVCQLSGKEGFNPRSSHTKDLKNGTWCRLA